MTKFNEVKRLPLKLSYARMDRLKMINVFKYGQRVDIRINDMPIDSFVAPCTQNIDRMLQSSCIVPLNSNLMTLTCTPKVTKFAGLEASFQVGMNPSCKEIANNKHKVALASIKCDAHLFELGERYYVIANGTMGDFCVHGVSHQQAVYSFFGRGPMRKLDEMPERRHYFSYTGSIGSLCIVDHANRVVQISNDDSCVVTLNLISENGSSIYQTHVIVNDGKLEQTECSTTDFTAHDIVVITDKTENDRTWGTRVDIELVQLKTGPIFQPHSFIVIELAGCKKLCSAMTDQDGVIDMCLNNLVVHRETFGKLEFYFRDNDTGEMVYNIDGKFEAIFHLRVIEL